MTEACRRPRFSSCNAFTLNLYVSSSTLRTRLCCCSDSILFWSCSLVTGDGGIIIGPPSIELESLSDALSRSAIFLKQKFPSKTTYNSFLLIARSNKREWYVPFRANVRLFSLKLHHLAREIPSNIATSYHDDMCSAVKRISCLILHELLAKKMSNVFSDSSSLEFEEFLCYVARASLLEWWGNIKLIDYCTSKWLNGEKLNLE